MVDVTKWENVKNMIHMRLISSEWQPEQFEQAVKVSVAADVWRVWYLNLETTEDEMTGYYADHLLNASKKGRVARTA